MNAPVVPEALWAQQDQAGQRYPGDTGKIKFGFIATDVTQNSRSSDAPYLLGIPFLPVLLGFLLHPKFHSITQSYNTTQPCHRGKQPQKADMADGAKKSPTTSGWIGLFGCSKHTS